MAGIGISGIVSGMDTESLITKLMDQEKKPLDKLTRTKTLNEYKQDIYTDINKKIANFILDTKKSFGLVSSGATGSYTSNVTTSLDWFYKATLSDTTSATATARANAMQGTFKAQIHQLASTVQKTSTASLGSLSSLKTQFSLSDSDTISFKIAGTKSTPPKTAKLNSGTLDDNTALQWEAVTPGVDGNKISVQMVNDAASSTPTVDVSGTDIKIHIKADDTTAAQVITAVTGSSAASALISVKNYGVSTGAGKLTEVVARTTFDGGSGMLGTSVAAALTTGTADSNAINLTAKTSGLTGNNLSIKYADPGTASSALSVSVTGSAITVNLATDASGTITSTVDDVVAALNGDASSSALVTAAKQGFTSGTAVVAAQASTNLTGGAEDTEVPPSYTFTYSGTNLTSKTIQDVVNDINVQSNSLGLGVRANYDTTANRFYFQTKSTGEESGFTITETGTVRMMTDSGSETGSNKLKLQMQDGKYYRGTDSIMDYAGAEGIISSSNTVDVNGVRFNLKAVSSSFNVTVAADVDSAYQKISAFVDSYNDMMSTISTTTTESRVKLSKYNTIQPLTDEEKQSLSDTEIEKWETKCKQGLLRADPILNRAMTQMRTGMYDTVSGVTGSYDQLTEIGITTETYSRGATSAGKLVIDSSKLMSALQDDPNGVFQLLFKEPSSDLKYTSESTMTADQLKQKRAESGLAFRLYDNAIESMTEVVDKAGVGTDGTGITLYRNVSSRIIVDFITKYSGISALDKENDEIETKMETLQDRLDDIETRYRTQFSNMEQAMQKLQAQQQQMLSKLGQSS